MQENITAKNPFEVRGIVTLLMVFDMPASLRFYRDILGFEIIQAAPPGNDDHYGWVLLRLNGHELMLNTLYEDEDENKPPVPDPARAIAHEDTSLYIGCPDIDAVYNHVTAKGYKAEKPSITGYGFKALYLKDPDGYYVIFHWPNQ